MALAAHRWAAVAVFGLGAYLQLVEWVDLYPWNDVRRGNGQEALDLALAAATVVLVAGLWVSRRWAPPIATAALAVWAWLQISTWWIPYVQGATPGWARVHARWFADTLQVLPGDARHLPPDANHLALHLLIVTALLASAWAALRGRRGS